MEIIGFSGLQSVFGGPIAAWKRRVKAGCPVLKEPGLRSGRARTFDSIVVYRWLLVNEPARLEIGELDRAQEQAQLFKIQAQRQALALAREKNQLLPAETVEKVWGGMTTAARARLLALPSRLAAECSGQDFSIIATRGEELVYEVLAELHRYDPSDYV